MPTDPVSKSAIGLVAVLALTAVFFIAIPQGRAIALGIANHYGFFDQDKRHHGLSSPKRKANGRLAVGVIQRGQHKGIAVWDDPFSPENSSHANLGGLSSFLSEFAWLGGSGAANESHEEGGGSSGELPLSAADKLLDTSGMSEEGAVQNPVPSFPLPSALSLSHTGPMLDTKENDQLPVGLDPPTTASPALEPSTLVLVVAAGLAALVSRRFHYRVLPDRLRRRQTNKPSKSEIR